MAFDLNRCLFCGAELPSRNASGAGRPRRYCSEAHRKRAYKQRRQRVLEPLPGIDATVEPLPATAPTDELITITVLEAKSAAASFARLSLTARREFAWRCERAGRAIARTLADNFPGV